MLPYIYSLPVNRHPGLLNFMECYFCGHNAFVKPVQFTEVDNVTKLFCGRCFQNRTIHKKYKLVRDTLFEKMMKLLVIPCSYIRFGCTYTTNCSDNSLMEHEDKCLFKVEKLVEPPPEPLDSDEEMGGDTKGCPRDVPEEEGVQSNEKDLLEPSPGPAVLVQKFVQNVEDKDDSSNKEQNLLTGDEEKSKMKDKDGSLIIKPNLSTGDEKKDEDKDASSSTVKNPIPMQEDEEEMLTLCKPPSPHIEEVVERVNLNDSVEEINPKDVAVRLSKVENYLNPQSAHELNFLSEENVLEPTPNSAEATDILLVFPKDDRIRRYFLCRNCSKTLSVLPIYRNIDSSYICGRCVKGKPEMPNTMDEQKVYMKFALNMTFQCCHSGCHLFYKTTEISEHEEDCELRKLPCPIIENNITCAQLIPLMAFRHHLETNHLVTSETGVTFNFTQFGNKETFVFRSEDQLFVLIVERKHVKSKEFFLFTLLGTGSVRRKIYLNWVMFQMDNGESVSPNVQDEDIKVLLNKDCFAFPDSLTRYNDSDEHNIRYIISVDPEKLNHDPRLGDVNCTILVNRHMERFKKDLYEQLKCETCQKYFLMQSVFLCKKGHSICAECMRKSHLCPMCNQEFYGPRNYALEAVAQNVLYPCDNEKTCNASLIPEQWSKHQVACNSGLPTPVLSCFFGCGKNMENYFEIYKHIEEAHSKLKIWPGDEELIHCLKDGIYEIKRIVFFFDEIFKIYCRRQKGQPFVFFLQNIKPHVERPYHLELFEPSKKQILYDKSNSFPFDQSFENNGYKIFSEALNTLITQMSFGVYYRIQLRCNQTTPDIGLIDANSSNNSDLFEEASKKDDKCDDAA